MTLFDAVVGLVLLGLAAVGFLGAFQAASRSSLNTAEWVQAVGYAEATVEETKLGAALTPLEPASGYGRTLTVQPWDGARGIERLTITITLPRGGAFVVHRLVAAP